MNKGTLLARNAVHGLETAIELSNDKVYLQKQHAIAILELLKKQKWTSIKERHPGKEGFYLVSGGGKIWIAMSMKLKNIHGFCNDCKNPTIEAWMPLPEPYNRID